MTTDRKFAGLVVALAAGAFALAPMGAALAQSYDTRYDSNQAQYQAEPSTQRRANKALPRRRSHRCELLQWN